MTYPLKVKPAFAEKPWHKIVNSDAELLAALAEAIPLSPVGETVVITDPAGF